MSFDGDNNLTISLSVLLNEFRGQLLILVWLEEFRIWLLTCITCVLNTKSALFAIVIK
jgi:hypothetical protein